MNDCPRQNPAYRLTLLFMLCFLHFPFTLAVGVVTDFPLWKNFGIFEWYLPPLKQPNPVNF
jgi:hypothetical protein